MHITKEGKNNNYKVNETKQKKGYFCVIERSQSPLF